MGERVRRKQDGSVWKLIGETEGWEEGEAGAVPVIRVRFRNEASAPEPGAGPTLTETFAPSGPGFEDRWEILYDW